MLYEVITNISAERNDWNSIVQSWRKQISRFRITSYNVCYTKLLRFGIAKSVSSLSAYKKFQAQYLEGSDAQKTKTLKPETLAMLGEEQAATQVVVANTKTAPEVKTNKPAQTGNNSFTDRIGKFTQRVSNGNHCLAQMNILLGS